MSSKNDICECGHKAYEHHDDQYLCIMCDCEQFRLADTPHHQSSLDKINEILKGFIDPYIATLPEGKQAIERAVVAITEQQIRAVQHLHSFATDTPFECLHCGLTVPELDRQTVRMAEQRRRLDEML